MDILTLDDDALFLICQAIEDATIQQQREDRKHQRRDDGALPTILSFGMTCKRIRLVCTPILYRKAVIRNYAKHERKVFDPNTTLQSLQSCPLFQQHGRALTINLVDHAFPCFPLRFLAGLSALPRLDKLRIVTTDKGLLEAIQSAADFDLPALRTLVLGRETARFTTPNFGHGSRDRSSYNYIGPARLFSQGNFGNLRQLELSTYLAAEYAAVNCTVELLETLRLHCPRLETLGTLSCSGDAGAAISIIFPALAKLPALTTLALDSPENLVPKYPANQQWRAVYDPDAVADEKRRMRRRVVRDVGEGVFRHCRLLRVLWMLEQGRATCGRYEGLSLGEVVWEDGERGDVF